MTAVKVFISSREQELASEREIAARKIKNLGMMPIRFEVDLSPQHRSTKEAFLEGVRDSQLILIILWQEYSPAVEEEFNQARRLRKDIICLLKDVKAELEEKIKDRKLPQFINKIRTAGVTTRSFRTLEELESRIMNGISLYIYEKIRSPFIVYTKEELFTRGTELIINAVEDVILVARTPVLLVGPRPYDGSRSPEFYEVDQFEALQGLSEKAAKGETPRFTCTYSVDKVLKAINEEKSKDKKKGNEFALGIKKRLEECYKKMARPNSNFSLMAITEEIMHPNTFLVADDNFIIWFKHPIEGKIYISHKDNKICSALHSLCYDISQTLDLNKQLSILRLKNIKS